MNPFQIVMIGLATALILSVLWTPLKEMLKRVPSVVGLSKKPKATADSSLVEIIACWESLKNKCNDRGLSKASLELDKIFPLFVEKGGKNV
mgnify:CR=1 FL=1|tara:strand:+ start:201 stop:473 length:273 start_codon:yes stop_codon:yes gene_type:complete